MDLCKNIGMVGTSDLTGYNTYRVYVKFSSPDDFLTAVYGDAISRLKSGWKQLLPSAVGALTNEGYNLSCSRWSQTSSTTASLRSA